MKNKENESVGQLFYLQKCTLSKMKCAFCVVVGYIKDRVEVESIILLMVSTKLSN